MTGAAAASSISCLAGYLAEGLWSHSIDAPVGIAMTGHLVLCHGDAPHQLRIPLGHPAEHEEGGVYRGVIEQSKDFFSVLCSTRLSYRSQSATLTTDSNAAT